MDAFQIVDALAASFFGLIGIWAATMRKHWFLRFVVVSVFLLSTLLITAYEVAIEFGIQIALLMLGVWLARGREHWQIRFSIETALLAMVVVAVVSAVIGGADHLTWWTWRFLITNGICTAAYGLTALWLVFGKTRLRYRIPLGVLCVGVILSVYHFSEGLAFAIWEQLNNGDWFVRLSEHYVWSNVSDWLSRNGPPVVLGATILCTALVLARESGWFDFDSAQETKSSGHKRIARLGLIIVLSAISMPLLYIFYRLMTPAQYPAVAIAEPNGYDDIVAAGNMIDGEIVNLALQNSWNMPDQQLRTELDKLVAPFERISVGLAQPNFQVRYHPSSTVQSKADRKACYKVAAALLLRGVYLDRVGDVDEQLDWAFDVLKLRKVLVEGWQITWPESEAVWRITKLLPKYDASTCQRLVDKLYRHDRERESLEEYLHQYRVNEENRGWEKHYRTIVKEWNGKDPYQIERVEYQWNAAWLRLLITQLGVQRYYLENNRLPDSPSELIPDMLPEWLSNPYDGQPIEYRNLWGGYALICPTTDGEQPVIFTGPAAPYFWQRLQESWQEFRDWLSRFPTAPR